MKEIVDSNILDKLKDYLKEHNKKRLFLITDKNVENIYLEKVLSYLGDFDVKVHILQPGEKSKSVDVLFSIYDELIQFNSNRHTTIISLGGGVVGDISGFVAATYMRGMDFIQIPTTLLAQVDSSIGGKVGIDYKGLKNIIGSFYFPEQIFIDVAFLQTLDDREITSGLGEVLKCGLIKDYELFKYINNNLDKIYDKEEDVLIYIVEKSINIKKKVVKLDEKEKNIRKILNFGHTVGHSIEALYDFEKHNHGEAIILGMIYESYISKEIGLIDKKYFNEIYEVLTKLIKPKYFTEGEISNMLDIMYHDKKNIDKKIGFVLPVGRGKVRTMYNIDEKIIKKSLEGRWI